jgi:hypothetical protein
LGLSSANVEMAIEQASAVVVSSLVSVIEPLPLAIPNRSRSVHPEQDIDHKARQGEARNAEADRQRRHGHRGPRFWRPRRAAGGEVVKDVDHVLRGRIERPSCRLPQPHRGLVVAPALVLGDLEGMAPRRIAGILQRR